VAWDCGHSARGHGAWKRGRCKAAGTRATEKRKKATEGSLGWAKQRGAIFTEKRGVPLRKRMARARGIPIPNLLLRGGGAVCEQKKKNLAEKRE